MNKRKKIALPTETATIEIEKILSVPNLDIHVLYMGIKTSITSGISIKTYGSFSGPTLERKIESETDMPIAIPACNKTPNNVKDSTLTHSFL